MRISCFNRGVAIAVALIMAMSVNAAAAVSDTITLVSDLIPVPMKVTVVRPSAEGRYPSLYLLNGHGGDYRKWPSVVNIDSIADRYGMVVVCPSGMNSWYYDAPARDDMKMESFITGELVAAVDSAYPTLARREMRAVTGLSMGGHGALWLAIRNPEIFGSAGSTSGGVDITPFPNNWNLAEMLGRRDDNPELWRAHTVSAAVDTLTPGRLNIVFDCGTEDFFYPVNCELDAKMNSRKIPHEFFTMPGAHNNEYWSRSIWRQVEFFDRVFKAAEK